MANIPNHTADVRQSYSDLKVAKPQSRMSLRDLRA